MWAAIKARLRREPVPSEPKPASPTTPRPTSAAPESRASGASPPKPRSPSIVAEEHFTEGLIGTRLAEATVDDLLDELEIALLQSDVALPVVERVRRDLRKNLAGRKLKWGADAETAVRESLERTVNAILSRPPPDLVQAIAAQQPKPFVILFVGVNGTGKTTSVAKIAGWLRDRHLGVVIAAGDTFRAGAIEQLLVHGERLGIRVIRQQEGSDPAAVAFDAVQHARAKGVDVVLVDTAGRQHTNENLIAEAKKIRRVVAPQLTLFVGDALSGNDVVTQAKLFQQELGIDALVLTKLDADAKGGAALSTTFVTGKPILFVGVGQKYSDLVPFDPAWLVHRLFEEGTAS